jgi:hypothetical protein
MCKDCIYLSTYLSIIYLIFKTTVASPALYYSLGARQYTWDKKLHFWLHMVQILCTHVCTWKNDAAETIPRMGEGGSEEWWRG